MSIWASLQKSKSSQRHLFAFDNHNVLWDTGIIENFDYDIFTRLHEYLWTQIT